MIRGNQAAYGGGIFSYGKLTVIFKQHHRQCR
jgi:predicted outer membrane repeat protein